MKTRADAIRERLAVMVRSAMEEQGTGYRELAIELGVNHNWLWRLVVNGAGYGDGKPYPKPKLDIASVVKLLDWMRLDMADLEPPSQRRTKLVDIETCIRASEYPMEVQARMVRVVKAVTA